MKVNITQRLKADADLLDLLRRMAYQINTLSEGSMAAKYTARTAPPTTGKWAQGDEVANSAPTVAGTSGSQYVVTGWKCVSGGEPGTWVDMRTLTGT